MMIWWQAVQRRNIRTTARTLTLLIVTAGFIGLLWLTQSLIRRGMDDGSNG